MLKKLMLVVSFAFAAACGGGSDKDEATDCVDAFLCAAECNTDACVQGCIDDAGDKAQQQMIELATCSEEHNCDDEDCLQAKCADELDACMN